MKNKSIFFILILSTLFLAPDASQGRTKIEKISIIGNTSVASDNIRQLLHLKIGEITSPEAIDNQIENFEQLGADLNIFESLKVYRIGLTHEALNLVIEADEGWDWDFIGDTSFFMVQKRTLSNRIANVYGEVFSGDSSGIRGGVLTSPLNFSFFGIENTISRGAGDFIFDQAGLQVGQGTQGFPCFFRSALNGDFYFYKNKTDNLSHAFLGPSLYLEWDRRDSRKSAQKGTYLAVSVSDLFAPDTDSFGEITADFLGYHPVMSGQLALNLKLSKLLGAAPLTKYYKLNDGFFDALTMRQTEGFRKQSKNIGSQMIYLSTEYRQIIWDPLALVFFSDIGDAWEDGKAIDFNVLSGIGIRIPFPMKINSDFRIEYGRDKFGSRVYFGTVPYF